MKKNSYTVRAGVFRRDGHDLYCPFRQPFPVTEQKRLTGGPAHISAFMQFACGEQCPLFEYQPARREEASLWFFGFRIPLPFTRPGRVSLHCSRVDVQGVTTENPQGTV